MVEIVSALTVMFVAASLVILSFHRYGHPVIPAYIIAGVVVGAFIDETQVLQLAHLGIAFLVFVFGMRLDANRVYRLVQGHFSTTMLQVGIVGLGAFFIAWLWRFSPMESLLLAVAASLSSSLVGTEILARTGQGEHIHGRLSEAINLVQDLIAILLFVALAVVTTGRAAAVPTLAWIAVIFTAAAALRWSLPYITGWVGSSRETMMLTALTILSVFILMADRAGVSIVVGSFAAGVAVSKFPFNLEMMETTTSLKDFFAAIFFVAVGAAVSFPTATGIIVAVALFFATVFLKPAVTVMSVEYHGYDSRTAYLTALNVDQVSEFTLFLAIQLFLAGTIGPEVFHAVVLAAAASMVTSSYTSRHGDEIYRYIEEHGLIDPVGETVGHEVEPGLSGHCIVAGFDVQGKEIGRFLAEKEVPFVVIDNNPDMILEAQSNDYQYVFGNVFQDDTWRTAQLDDAALVISTVPFPSVSSRILDLETDADIVLRSEDREEALSLMDECLYVINSDVLGAERIADHIEKCLESGEYREQLREESRREML